MTQNGPLTDEQFRWGNVREVIQAARDFGELQPGLTLDRDDDADGLSFSLQPEVAPEGLRGLQAFMEQAVLVPGDPSDGSADTPEAVHLITMHKAKGLEFEAVCVAAMEDGQLPHYRSLDDQLEIDEERRLAYVAVTRAKRHLVMSHARTRATFGQIQDVERSQFLRPLAPLRESNGGGNEAQAYCDSNGDRESYSHDCNNTSWRGSGGSGSVNANADPVRYSTASATSSSLSSFSRQYSSSPVRSASKSSTRRTMSSSSDSYGGNDGFIRSDRSSQRSRRG